MHEFLYKFCVGYQCFYYSSQAFFQTIIRKLTDRLSDDSRYSTKIKRVTLKRREGVDHFLFVLSGDLHHLDLYAGLFLLYDALFACA